MLAPSEEAAAILGHYLSQLARQCGLKWTERNQADIERAAELLSFGDEPESADEIPPTRRRSIPIA